MNYNKINPAVAKQILSQMDKICFINESKKIKHLLLDFDVSKPNQRLMLKSLYLWCKSFYIANFL